MKFNIQLSSTAVKSESNLDAPENEEIVKLDRRLQRLQRLRDDQPAYEQSTSNQQQPRRRRHFEPEVIEEEATDEDLEQQQNEDVEGRHALIRERLIKEDNEKSEKPNRQLEESSEEEEESEEESSSDEASDEDSDDDEFFNSVPRLKPIFVRKEERHSIINQKKELEEKTKQEEINNRKAAEDRRKDALKIIEKTVQKERLELDRAQNEVNFESINSVKTDDESDEVAYLNWKLRELKRNKRDKDEREAMVKQREATERLRNMTEEERIEELKKNPKEITNKQDRGKYKFMQKYYHRGAFFMDQEEDVYKRDIAKPTLEDHFDKAILPKVMQVSN